jgi:hypothetical protein
VAEDQTNDRKVESTTEDSKKAEETKEVVETNPTGELESKLGDIIAKFEEYLPLFAKLKENPESVNAQGLAHLEKQTKGMRDAIVEIGDVIKKSHEQLNGQLQTALQEIGVSKLEKARADVMAKYGLGPESTSLLSKVTKIEEIDAFAKDLAGAIKAKVGSNAPQSLTRTTTPDGGKTIPRHLQGLADSMRRE